MSDEPINLPAIIEDEPPASAAWERVTDVVAMRKEIARLEHELNRARRKWVAPSLTTSTVITED